MKKLLKLTVLICCFVLCCFCFSGCFATNLDGKIEITGKRINEKSLDSFITSRENGGAQDEENQEIDWFDVNIEINYYIGEESTASATGTVLMIGKMGIVDENKYLLDLDFSITDNEVEEGVETAFTFNGDLIFVDNVFYLNLHKVKTENGETTEETIKKMGSQIELDDEAVFDFNHILAICMDYEFDKSDFIAYSIDESGTVSENKEDVLFKFYRDDDSLFAESKDAFSLFGFKIKFITQYQYDFAPNSTKVLAKKFYTRYFFTFALNIDSAKIEAKLDSDYMITMTRCEEATITAPDSEGYEWVE
jgi:hypothetical protein